MRFDRIQLSNFKPYADAAVDLEPGVTVIHGPNGSGKSSLLEACFFALYGTTPPFERTLEEVVTIGAEETTVELQFDHAGASYRLRRELRATGDRVQTASCVLDTPEGPIEGVQDVEAHVRALLRMDAEAFVNCAYVRQGEINKLIEASPTERQDMIDGLLQLGKLEDYRERAAEARLAVTRLGERWADRLADRAEQIEALEDQDLHERLNDLESELNEVDAEIERFEANREEAQETLAAAEAHLEEVAEKREALADLEEAIADLRERIAETETAREATQEELADHRARLEDLEAAVASALAETEVETAEPSAVDARRRELAEQRETVIADRDEVISALQAAKNEADRQADRAEELRERAEAAEEAAEERASEAEEAAEAAEDVRETIAELDDEIEARRDAFEDAPIDFGAAEAHRDALEEDLEDAREEETEVREALATARSRVEEAEALLAEGKCPECGQPIEGSPHVESLEDYRETVDSLAADLASVEETRDAIEARIDRAEALVAAESRVTELRDKRALAEERLADREAAVEAARDAAGDRREAAADLVAEAEAAETAAADARETVEEKQAELGRRNERQSELKARIERLDALADQLDERERTEAEIENLQEKRSMLADQNDERRETLAERRERRAALQEAVGDEQIESARAEQERAADYLAEVADHLEALDERRDELVGAIDTTEDRLDRLDALRAERDELAARADALDSLRSEAETLETTYGDLRGELRQRNVARLEALVNETFDLVYGNDAYARIELSPTYELTVYQKDGEPLAPEQLSGGERALFNLALRTAIYRLLGEGIEGAAPMPPLILDEPTVFLDTGHVSRLVDLVESMRELGVEQIVVVSHDEDLVGAADDLLLVEKDPTTNRSTVRRARSTLPPTE